MAVAQVNGQLIAVVLTELLVLGGVGGDRLGQDLLDDLLIGARREFRGARVQLGPVDRDDPNANEARLGAERQHVTEQIRESLLVALAKARDRRVIGNLVGRDHPERDVLHAAPLDHPR